MSNSPPLSRKSRSRVAVVLLVLSLVFVAVSASALFVGSADPRDSLGSRAAGFGFSDWSRPVLFSATSIALPLVATLLSDVRSISVFAAVEYGVMALLGVLIAVSSLLFNLDVAGMQQNAVGVVFIDQRSAIERFIVDLAVVALMVIAGLVAVYRGRASGAAREQR